MMFSQPATLRASAVLSPKAKRKLREKMPGSPKQIVLYFLKNYPGTLLASLSAIIVAGLVESIGVAALLPLFGSLTGGQASLPPPLDRWFALVFEWAGMEPTLNVLLTIVLSLLLIKLVVSFTVMVFVGWVQARVTGEFRSRLIDSLGNVRWPYFMRQASGRLAKALMSETGNAASGLMIICQLLAAATQVVIFGGMASLISWEATLIGLLASLLSAGLLVGVIRMMRENQRERIITMSNMTSRLLDSLNNMKTLKAMGAERRMTKLISRDIAEIRRLANIDVLLNQGTTLVQELIKLLAVIGAFFFLFMVAGQPLEQILVVLLLFLRIMTNVRNMQNKYKALVACEAPFEHVQQLMAELAAEEEALGGYAQPLLNREIRIEDASFAYERERILDGVNLEIPAGSIVCLAGPSGSGKTTLLDMICGLARPQQGEVFLDGIPLRQINLRRWRRQIGYVPQELTLFYDTLLANVTLGDERIPTGQVEEALRAAGAWSFVETLPEGLDTVVGERGTRFSGGQRQRISIARALVRRPRLLILDEATANLDPATARELCKTLAGLRGEVTILAATHQTELTEIADEVYGLHNARLERVSAPRKPVSGI